MTNFILYFRVLELEKKKELLASKVRKEPSEIMIVAEEEEEIDDGNDSDKLELMDWRAKKGHK